MVFGFRHAGNTVLFKLDTAEQSAADQISVADQVSQQVGGSHCLSILAVSAKHTEKQRG